MSDFGTLPIIKVVGMSGSGKSTLVRGLRQAGYDARPVSQEHSNIPTLWQQFDRPWILIYLHVDLHHQRIRRPDVTWTRFAFQAEQQRLSHARDHADIRLDTSGLTPDEVLILAVTYLRHLHTKHAEAPLSLLPATGTAARPSGTKPGNVK